MIQNGPWLLGSSWSRPGGVAHDQLGGQLDVQCIEPLALHEPDKKTDGEAAHFLQWLTHGCELGTAGLSEVDVVEAGDGEFFGYAQSTLGGPLSCLDRSAMIGFPVTSVFALERSGTYKADSLSGTCQG